jgi:hypothetical protein
MTGRISILLIGLIFVAGCASTPREGVISGVTSPGGANVGTTAPDVKYRSLEGKETGFNRVRRPVAIVAFVAPEGPNCCWLEPRVVTMADQLWDLPVTVAQFSLPTSQCPHGPGCVEVCNMRQNRVMSLCDAQRLTWNAYGKPAPGTLILIGADGKIAMKGSRSDPKPVVGAAKRLGQIEKDRSAPGGERMQIY